MFTLITVAHLNRATLRYEVFRKPIVPYLQ